MKQVECKVCGAKFTPISCNRYEVVIDAMFGPTRIGEAFDCPVCGCQHVLNTRYAKINEDNNLYKKLFKEMENI